MRGRYESVRYLDFVRAQPCAACGRAAPSEPHHFMAGGGGMSRKCDDTFVTPLCRTCHRGWHDNRYLPPFKPETRSAEAFRLAVAKSEACMYQAQSKLLARYLRSVLGSITETKPDLF